MTARFGTALLAALVIYSPAFAANEVIVNETFDNYDSQFDFEQVWTMDLGTGHNPEFTTKGILVPTDESPAFVPPNVPDNNQPYASPAGVQGKAVSYGLSGINEFNGPVLGTTQMADLIPTAATESTPANIIRLTADIFEAGSLDGEPAGVLDHRTTVRLRNDTVQRAFGVFGTNFIEMGHWNAAVNDPSIPGVGPYTPGPYTPSGFAYRATIFAGVVPEAEGGNATVQPDWQYFRLDPALDLNGNGTTQQNDVDLYAEANGKERWHTYSVDIGVDFVKFSLDLFRDGLNNATGQAGVDSEVTWMLRLNNNATEPHAYDPFTSLAFGAPSGTSVSQLYSSIDNIKLELVDLIEEEEENADFDGNGFVDGTDFLIWQRNLGAGNQTQGDANGDGNIDGLDLDIWANNIGAVATGAAQSIPEPSSVALAGLALVAGVAASRRRR